MLGVLSVHIKLNSNFDMNLNLNEIWIKKRYERIKRKRKELQNLRLGLIPPPRPLTPPHARPVSMLHCLSGGAHVLGPSPPSVAQTPLITPPPRDGEQPRRRSRLAATDPLARRGLDLPYKMWSRYSLRLSNTWAIPCQRSLRAVTGLHWEKKESAAAVHFRSPAVSTPRARPGGKRWVRGGSTSGPITTGGFKSTIIPRRRSLTIVKPLRAMVRLATTSIAGENLLPVFASVYVSYST
jgi:hypothetical protein